MADDLPEPPSTPQQFEAELAAFTRANQRRSTRVGAIAALACFAIGVIIAIVGVAAKQGSDGTWAQGRGESGEIRMFLYAIGFFVVSAILARGAYRSARGREP
jgi:hypothetical protein